MPGSLPNTTIKNALDQAIQAINDLEISLSSGDVSIVVETTGLTAKLEEIRTLYETESLAQTVAQNTNFSDLIAAIAAQTAAVAALTLSCETIVNTTTLNQTINAGGACSGGSEAPPVISTDPASEPPAGWGPADPAIPDRRCKSCNKVIDGLDYIVTKLFEANFSNIALTLGLGVAAGVFFTVVSAPAAGPVSVLIGILGAVATGVLLFTAGSLRLDFLKGLFDDEEIRTEMVCALYNAGNAEQAIDDLIQVLDDYAANSAEKAAIQGILELSGATNSIDYSRGGSEVDLSSYVPTVDCDDCGGANWWNCIHGDIVSYSFTQIVISSTDAGGDQSANLSVPGIAESWNITLVSGTLNTPVGVPESCTRWSDLEGADCTISSGDGQWNEVLGTHELGNYPSITAFALRSSTAFSIRIERL